MARHWLDSAIDWAPHAESAWEARKALTSADRKCEPVACLFRNRKDLSKDPVATLQRPRSKDNKDANEKTHKYIADLARSIREKRSTQGLTLVIVNTVDRAVALYSDLSDLEPSLIHSRFRPVEREAWKRLFAATGNGARLIISTQVVEAGVDISAAVLFTELAPWASLVQRFGRCARFPDEHGQICWMDIDLGERQPNGYFAIPYERDEIVAARQRLRSLGEAGQAGLSALSDVKATLDAPASREEVKKLFPYEPRFVPRDKDLFDLFDTTPDLTGADVDVSRFIRDGEELDVHVFWRDFARGEKPVSTDRPRRCELCAVPFVRFRQRLRSLCKAGRVWRRKYNKYRKGWEEIGPGQADEIYPGQVYMLEKTCCGYDPQKGWTGETDHTDFVVLPPNEPTKGALQDDDDGADDLSQSPEWLTVLEHSRNVCTSLAEIVRSLDIPEPDKRILCLAARWHDRGKAHVAFETKLKPAALDAARQRLGGEPAAKAPDAAWSNSGSRPGFRHELASALAVLETLRAANPAHNAFAWPEALPRPPAAGASVPPAANLCDNALTQELAALPPEELDLLVYLVAAHHGKVRVSIRSLPTDDRPDVPQDMRQARGVRDGDSLRACQIPAADFGAIGIAVPEVTLSLDPMELGLSRRYGSSWRERMQLLLERLGPFRLAYLEAILRAADCRASAEEDERATLQKKGA